MYKRGKKIYENLVDKCQKSPQRPQIAGKLPDWTKRLFINIYLLFWCFREYRQSACKYPLVSVKLPFYTKPHLSPVTLPVSPLTNGGEICIKKLVPPVGHCNTLYVGSGKGHHWCSSREDPDTLGSSKYKYYVTHLLNVLFSKIVDHSHFWEMTHLKGEGRHIFTEPMYRALQNHTLGTTDQRCKW